MPRGRQSLSKEARTEGGAEGAVGHAWRGRERDDVARDEREDRDILLCHPPTRCPWQARINDTVRIIVSGGID